MPTKLAQKHARAEEVNQVILTIASHGRRFFYNNTRNAFASMSVDKHGKVWFIDDYTGKRIYTHETTFGGRWKGFSHGGTLKDLIKKFRDYITDGTPLHPGWLGPERFSDSNIWGYDEEGMKAVREQCIDSPVFRKIEAVDAA